MITYEAVCPLRQACPLVDVETHKVHLLGVGLVDHVAHYTEHNVPINSDVHILLVNDTHDKPRVLNDQ